MALASFRVDLGSTNHQDDLHFELPPSVRRCARRCSGFAFLFFLLICFCASLHAQATAPSDCTAGGYNPCDFSTARIMAVIENPPSDLITVSSHRGLHALIDGANQLVPENSLQAIGLAAQAGLEMIELDIKLTSDGVPIMSHDQTWGRETCPAQNFVGTPFNPFLAQGSNANNDSSNVPVSSMSALNALTSLTLRDTVSVINANGGSSSCLADYQDGRPYVYPSTLQGVLNFLTENKIAMVLALDLRDGPAAEAAWKVIAATPDYLGNSYAKSTLFKIPGKAFLNPKNPGVFTDTTVFQNTFPRVNFTSPNTGDTTVLSYSDVNFQPVYNTGDIAKNLYGNESNMIDQLKAFETNSGIDVIAVEVQFKEPGGILSNVLSAARQNWATGGLESVSVFSPYVDYNYPSDATQTPLFFTTSGYCCVPLAAFYYGPTMANPNGPNSPNPAIPFPTVPNPNYIAGQPTDTADERGNLSFVISQGYNSVTRDDAAQFVQLVAAAGDRNISYMRTGGPDPNCQPGIGQYPGCEADSLTTYTLCANNGGTCGPFTGDRNVAYGANGIYTTLTFTNTVPCIAGSFPGAAPGAGNSCYISPPISYVPPVNTGTPTASGQGYPVYCADESGTCNFNGLQSLLFGVVPYWAANHAYSSGSYYISSGSYPCALSSFSADPAIGHVKACFYWAQQQFLVTEPAPRDMGSAVGRAKPAKFRAPQELNTSVMGSSLLRWSMDQHPAPMQASVIRIRATQKLVGLRRPPLPAGRQAPKWAVVAPVPAISMLRAALPASPRIALFGLCLAGIAESSTRSRARRMAIRWISSRSPRAVTQTPPRRIPSARGRLAPSRWFTTKALNITTCLSK